MVFNKRANATGERRKSHTFYISHTWAGASKLVPAVSWKQVFMWSHRNPWDVIRTVGRHGAPWDHMIPCSTSMGACRAGPSSSRCNRQQACCHNPCHGWLECRELTEEIMSEFNVCFWSERCPPCVFGRAFNILAVLCSIVEHWIFFCWDPFPLSLNGPCANPRGPL